MNSTDVARLQAKLAKVTASSEAQNLTDFMGQAARAKERGVPSVYSAQLLPPYMNRMGYIAFHNDIAQKQQEEGSTEGKYPRLMKQTMRPAVQHGAAPLIRSLEPTTLREVAQKVNFIHQDKILFVRTTYAATRVVGTSMLVEDDAGDCLMLSLYNFVAPDDDPTDTFPVGTYMAILAPYMKNGADDRKRELMLRCDNPECIRLFPFQRAWKVAKRGKQLLVDANDKPADLRAQGNAAFQESKYETANRLYSRALACPEIAKMDQLACLSNRAEAKLRQKRWEGAEEDAKAALQIDNSHTKSKFRLATALLWRDKAPKASEVVVELLKANPKEKKFKLLQQDIRRALQEQQGQYNFTVMKKQASLDAPRPFHASFTSPYVQKGVTIVKQSGFQYRGCVATEDLKQRTLLSASKAFAYIGAATDKSLDMGFDPYNGAMDRGSTVALENEVVVLLHRRPELRSIFYALASGRVSEDNPSNKIDLARIRGILCSNVFSVHGDVKMGPEALLDNLQELRAEQETGRSPASKKKKEGDSLAYGSGLWLSESLFNHSCSPNCSWQQIADHMFIWTTRPIQAGEELCVSYKPVKSSFAEREKTFRNWVQPGVGFACQCDTCCALRASPDLLEAEERIRAAFKRASELVSIDGMETAAAVDYVLSAAQRKQYFELYSSFPFAVQHLPSVYLWVMQGSCLSRDRDHGGALAAFERAAEIGFAVRGGLDFDRAKDLWRVVGASLACGMREKAVNILVTIYADFFRDISRDPHANLIELTQHYALPWWMDNPGYKEQAEMTRLASAAARKAK